MAPNSVTFFYIMAYDFWQVIFGARKNRCTFFSAFLGKERKKQYYQLDQTIGKFKKFSDSPPLAAPTRTGSYLRKLNKETMF